MGPELNAVVSNSQSFRNNNNNVIWITGEFFGVQRARDMLYQVSVNKVGCRLCIRITLLTYYNAEQVRHLKRHRNFASKT